MSYSTSVLTNMDNAQRFQGHKTFKEAVTYIEEVLSVSRLPHTVPCAIWELGETVELIAVHACGKLFLESQGG